MTCGRGIFLTLNLGSWLHLKPALEALIVGFWGSTTYKTGYKKQMKKSKVLSQHTCYLLYCIYTFFLSSLRITAAYYNLKISNLKPVGERVTWKLIINIITRHLVDREKQVSILRQVFKISSKLWVRTKRIADHGRVKCPMCYSDTQWAIFVANRAN